MIQRIKTQRNCLQLYKGTENCRRKALCLQRSHGDPRCHESCYNSLFLCASVSESFRLKKLCSVFGIVIKKNDYPQNSPNFYKDNIVAKYKHRGTEVQSMDSNVLIIKYMARRNCQQFLRDTEICHRMALCLN